MSTLVSVIVPNYNHAPYLKQRIDSILNQTYQDFELILLDDCSSDMSRDIIESYRTNPHVSQIDYNDINSGTPLETAWLRHQNREFLKRITNNETNAKNKAKSTGSVSDNQGGSGGGDDFIKGLLG